MARELAAVHSGAAEENRYSFDLPAHAKGIYFVRVIANQRIANFKVIVQ